MLSPEESAHLVRVHRLREGDAVTLFDGNGSLWQGRLSSAHPKQVSVQVERTEVCPAPGVRIHLAQALPKGKLLDSLLNAGTQLGLSSLTPLLTERTDIRLQPERWAHQQARLESIAIEACKQSHNPFVPKIHKPITLEAFLDALPADCPRFYASLGPEAQAAASVSCSASDVVWIVGPEGGFSVQEDARIRAAGCQPICLGPHTLRLETAALCCVFLASLSAPAVKP